MLCKKLFFIFLTLVTVAYGNAQPGLAENSIIYSTNEAGISSDTTTFFTIRDIVIEGNKRTRPQTILRELSFRPNEQYSLSVLVQKFAEAKKQLLNTTLFSDVVVSLKSTQGYEAAVQITVRERWYFYPIPIVDMVDRNFQEWVKHKGMDLKRINYGIKLKYKNITGRNDKLDLNLINGYTKQVAVRYDGLILDKRMQWSSNLSVAFGKRKEINYINFNNRDMAYKNSDQFVHSYFRATVEASYRKAIKTKHTFGFGYNNEDISDTVFKLNPEFAFTKNHVIYPEFFYRVQYFDLDFIPYPTKGYAAELLLEKKGFNKKMNLSQLSARGSATWPVSPHSFFNIRMTGVIKLPFKQPYINQRFIGHNNMYLQGYEDYIIDGIAGGFAKATFSRQLLNTAVHISSNKVKRLNNIPIKIYGKVFSNTGYIYNNTSLKSSLSNQLLYSGGIGVDIVLFYDLIFRVEWSVNHLRQNGIYLHDKKYL